MDARDPQGSLFDRTGACGARRGTGHARRRRSGEIAELLGILVRQAGSVVVHRRLLRMRDIVGLGGFDAVEFVTARGSGRHHRLSFAGFNARPAAKSPGTAATPGRLIAGTTE
jgi:hypothetical protein